MNHSLSRMMRLVNLKSFQRCFLRWLPSLKYITHHSLNCAVLFYPDVAVCVWTGVFVCGHCPFDPLKQKVKGVA